MTARKYAPVCSYPECGRPHNARGLCGPHGTIQRQGKPLRPLLDRPGPIRRTDIERFTALVRMADNGCTEWVGGKTRGGYGTFAATTTHGAEKSAIAHRWAYEYHVGQIPADFDIDHLCRNRACVNPEHLEPVTRQENIRRAAAVKTHCPADHPYDVANTYVRPGTVHRKCRACSRERELARAEQRNASRRAQNAARGPRVRTLKTHCVRGHLLSGSNLYIAPKSGARGCRDCRRMHAESRAA